MKVQCIFIGLLFDDNQVKTNELLYSYQFINTDH